jgi:hypothetical protein
MSDLHLIFCPIDHRCDRIALYRLETTSSKWTLGLARRAPIPPHTLANILTLLELSVLQVPASMEDSVLSKGRNFKARNQVILHGSLWKDSPK